MTMKENKFDQLFKESLQGHEMPYDANAWAMLDKKLTSPKSSFLSNLKWFIGGAAILTLVVVAFQMQKSNEKTLKQSVRSNPENTSKNISETQNELESLNSKAVQQESKPRQVAQNNIENKNATPVQNQTEKKPTLKTTVHERTNNELNELKGNVFQSKMTNEDEPTINVQLPNIEKACLNDYINIENNNTVDLHLSTPNGNDIIIKANTSKKYKVDKTGTFTLSYVKNNQLVKQNTFIVSNGPDLNIDYDTEIKYENGIPTTIFTANTNATNCQWDFNGVSSEINNLKASAHFYKKGSYEISATATASNGCKTTETKKVYIEDNYNLMAVDAFNPNSTIDANRTFMPFALTERNVAFKLIIIDPLTGAVIFESADASQAWDGTDKRNGQMVDFNKSYIWKVSLNKSLPGERSDYSGTILVTSTR